MSRVKLKKHFVIYGAGGHAREIASLIIESGGSILCFVDDDNSNRTIGSLDVLNFQKAFHKYSGLEWIVAIGCPQSRRFISEKLSRNNVITRGFIDKKNAFIARDALIEAGAQVFTGAHISTGCNLAEGVIVHFGAIICHDVKVGPYTFIGPGAKISGHVLIGQECWIGVGATIVNGTELQPIKIGKGAIVGAGAVVTNDVAAGLTVTGVPARQITKKL